MTVEAYTDSPYPDFARCSVEFLVRDDLFTHKIQHFGVEKNIKSKNFRLSPTHIHLSKSSLMPIYLAFQHKRDHQHPKFQVYNHLQSAHQIHIR